MAGIAGIEGAHRHNDVGRMLDRIAHRGRAGREIVECDNIALGAVWTHAQPMTLVHERLAVRDWAGGGHLSQAHIANGRLVLQREALGVQPLYYGRTTDGALCFASEVKAMLEVTRDVNELPPGCCYMDGRIEPYFRLSARPALSDPPQAIADSLRNRLSDAIKKRIRGDCFGAWLSGGLDSSTIAALARPHVSTLHTFAGGLAGAPGLKYAREVAEFLDTRHHEVLLDINDLLAVLPRVIYHLESFDALLVRSSLLNYCVAQAAAEHVTDVFSGEGGDELFAGYHYLKTLAPADLGEELIDITSRLHNTALQRVDRCASAHGLVAHVCFLDPSVVEYAIQIPTDLKLHGGMEKWILRQAITGLLPNAVLNRPKAKFWEGGGVGERLAEHADRIVSDADFRQERRLPNGWVLRSKEELMYCRLFHEYFGELVSLDWMGRTKGAAKTSFEDRPSVGPFVASDGSQSVFHQPTGVDSVDL